MEDFIMFALEAMCILFAVAGIAISLTMGGVHNFIMGMALIWIASVIHKTRKMESNCPKPCK